VSSLSGTVLQYLLGGGTLCRERTLAPEEAVSDAAAEAAAAGQEPGAEE
jgi:hypothetical protein